MSRRFDRSWVVLRSVEDAEHVRCLDLFRRPDGSFGVEEFRRDVEDLGAWTPTHAFSDVSYPSEDAALAAARRTVPWLGEALDTGEAG